MKPTMQPALFCVLLIGAIFILLFTLPAQAEEDSDNLVIRLAERVDDLFGRVEALEAIYSGPGAPDRADGRTCLLGQVKRVRRRAARSRTRPSSNLWAMFNQAPIEHHLVSVGVEKESGEVILLYRARHEEGWAFVFEHWDGCQFVGISPWRPGRRVNSPRRQRARRRDDETA